ncbi:MAG: hypothetical protein LUD47_04100 [Clostridia bacterium]|nr:hypothetical protein [Clostridia bacterium]
MLKLTLCQTKKDGYELVETVDLDDCDDAEEMVKNLRACGFDIPDDEDGRGSLDSRAYFRPRNIDNFNANN